MNLLKNAKYYLYILLACCVMACGDDKNNDGDGDYSNSPLSPDEHKAKLETIGKDFVAKIKAEDHKQVTESLYCLGDLMGDDSFNNCLPEYMQSEDDNWNEEYPMNPMALARVIKNNDINTLMALATSSYDDEYKVSDFNGVYTYTNGIWAKTSAATGKWELQYTDAEHGNAASILTMTYSDLKTYTKVNNTSVEVPGKMTLTLIVAGKKVLELNNDITLTADMYNATINCSLTLADNYIWNLTASAAPDKVSSTFKMTVKGEELINGSAEVTGTKLTDPDNIEDNGADVLNNGKCEMNIMNIRLAGNGDIKAIINGEDKIGNMDPWDSDYTEAADKKNAEALMVLYNDYMKIEGFYTKEKEKFADIKMGLYSDTFEIYAGYDEINNEPIHKEVTDWDIQPILVFGDKSEMEFDTFFTETRFSSLINSVETLINKYMDMLGEDHVNL